MKKVFFLGLNYEQLDYLEVFKNLGYYIIGIDKNNKSPGAKLVDVYFQISYTDIKALLETVDEVRLSSNDQVFTSSSHLSYYSASRIAEKKGINFPKPKMVDICLDKSKLYPFFEQHNIPAPRTKLISDLKSLNLNLNLNKNYYLKSDYGKSPKYCYYIKNGLIPSLPKKYDDFFRKYFLLQEEFIGTHFRLNLLGEKNFIFLKESNETCIPKNSMGKNNQKIINSLKKVLITMGFQNRLVKFDVIVNNQDWSVIDIGLDPPKRLETLMKYHGIDFASAYTFLWTTGSAKEFIDWNNFLLSSVKIKIEKSGKASVAEI